MTTCEPMIYRFAGLLEVLGGRMSLFFAFVLIGLPALALFYDFRKDGK